eukprot:GHVR01136648.1.p1 GENE.GHVR01136648.1~~GHVR01136648.1.p1  ORF type:complete len:309 (+),score=20.55 GHVR01136648.1:495-1421(+)
MVYGSCRSRCRIAFWVKGPFINAVCGYQTYDLEAPVTVRTAKSFPNARVTVLSRLYESAYLTSQTVCDSANVYKSDEEDFSRAFWNFEGLRPEAWSEAHDRSALCETLESWHGRGPELESSVIAAYDRRAPDWVDRDWRYWAYRYANWHGICLNIYNPVDRRVWIVRPREYSARRPQATPGTQLSVLYGEWRLLLHHEQAPDQMLKPVWGDIFPTTALNASIAAGYRCDSYHLSLNHDLTRSRYTEGPFRNVQPHTYEDTGENEPASGSRDRLASYNAHYVPTFGPSSLAHRSTVEGDKERVAYIRNG